MAVNHPVSTLDVHSLLAMQEDGELHKLRKILSAVGNEQQEISGGWISVEMQHLVPILTALGSGVVLSATCLLLEYGTRCWRSRFERREVTAVGNNI
jgi:hypothetical protein